MVPAGPLVLADALGVAAMAYAAVAAWRVRSFGERAPAAEPYSPAVSVLKPLCGDEPQLYENLRSFLTLAYPEFQLVFGVRDPGDPALATVRRLQSEFPGRDIAIVVDSRSHGSNPKASNLINMMPAARHDVLVLADSDIRVPPDYLSRVVAPLARREVGAVTCLYTARPAVPCLAGRLGCLQINDWFLPSVLSAEVTGDVDFCLGSSIAMRRDALDAIGGFRALRNVLADDYTLGRTLVERGYRVILSDCLVETVVAETELTALLRHELRWARTIRAVRPLSFAGSILTNTITLSLVVALSLVLAGANPTLGLAVVAAAILARLVLHHEVGRRFAASNGASWLLPLRDLLSTAVWAASYLGRDVNWRGRALTVDRGGILMNKTE